MGVVGIAGLVVLSGLLCGFAVYAVCSRQMDRDRNTYEHKVEQLNATIKQLSRIANGRRVVSQKYQQLG